jgi:transcription termination factor Rho
MGTEELSIVWRLRRVLHALEPQQALELLLEKMKGTKSNVEFLLQIQKTTIGGDSPAASATANKESVEA